MGIVLAEVFNFLKPTYGNVTFDELPPFLNGGDIPPPPLFCPLVMFDKSLPYF